MFELVKEQYVGFTSVINASNTCHCVYSEQNKNSAQDNYFFPKNIESF